MILVYWFFGLSALTLAIYLMVKCFGLARIFSPNVILVMFVCHILQQLGASIVFMFDPGTQIAPLFFLACALTALLIPIGGLIGDVILPVKPEYRARFRFYPAASDLQTRTIVWRSFFIFFVFCAILLVLYIHQTPSMPLKTLLTSELDPEEQKLARREGGAGAVGLVFSIGLRFFMPLLFLMAIMGLSYFKSTAARLICAAAIPMALLYNAWGSSKTPVAMMFLLAIVVMLLKRDERDLSRRQADNVSAEKKADRKKRKRIYLLLAIFVALMIGYPVFIFLFKPAAEQGLGYLFLSVFLRIIWKPAINSFVAFEAFTYYWDYTYFTDLKRFSDLFGLPYFDLSERIAVYRGLGEITNSPPTAVGNFYAQGGWPVLILGVLFASTLFKVIENIFYKVKIKTMAHVGLYALLLYGAFRFSWASFHTVLLSETIGPLLVVLIAWHMFARLQPRLKVAHQ